MPTTHVSLAAIPARRLEADALLALAGLGFRRVEAHPVVSRILDAAGPGVSLDIVIRDSLRELGPRG